MHTFIPPSPISCLPFLHGRKSPELEEMIRRFMTHETKNTRNTTAKDKLFFEFYFVRRSGWNLNRPIVHNMSLQPLMMDY